MDDPEVSEALAEIAELGYLHIRDGKITDIRKPLDCIYSTSWDRWTPTLRYLADYAAAHDDFGGHFFLCTYDGWREYSEPTLAPSERRYIRWRDIAAAHRRENYIGRGNIGEPRFRAAYPPATDPAIYPELPLPVIAYNRHIADRNVLLIPDSEFLENQFSSFRTAVEQHDIPFADKVPKFYWRGSPNMTDGYSYVPPDTGFGERAHQRGVAVAIAAYPQVRNIMTASFEKTPIQRMLNFKYQLDLDGLVSAWSAGYWKLLSNSVVVRPPSHWEHWYSDQLTANRHYLPLADFRPTTIMDTFNYAEQHPDEMADIAAASTAFAKKLTYEYAVHEYRIR